MPVPADTTPIADLGLSAKAETALLIMGFATAGDVRAKSDADLLAVHFPPNLLAETRAVLAGEAPSRPPSLVQRSLRRALEQVKAMPESIRLRGGIAVLSGSLGPHAEMGRGLTSDELREVVALLDSLIGLPPEPGEVAGG